MIHRLKWILYHGIRLVGGFAVAQRITRTQLRILGYHGISIRDEHELAPYVFMRPETFARRMRILRKRGLAVVSLDEAIKRLSTNSIASAETVITFDDGWASDLLVMPILEQYGFPACIYVTTEHVSAGAEDADAFNVTLAQMVRRSRSERISLRNVHPLIDGDYDVAPNPAATTERLLAATAGISLQERQKLLAPLAEALGLDYAAFIAAGRFRFLSGQQIASLARKGVSVQLHTHTHRLPSGAFDEMADEIRQNRSVIAELTGIAPTHFCYPSGEYAPWHPEWLAKLGIASGATCESGFNDSNGSLLLLKRYLDSESASDIEFEAEVAGVRELLRRTRSALGGLLSGQRA